MLSLYCSYKNRDLYVLESLFSTRIIFEKQVCYEKHSKLN